MGGALDRSLESGFKTIRFRCPESPVLCGQNHVVSTSFPGSSPTRPSWGPWDRVGEDPGNKVDIALVFLTFMGNAETNDNIFKNADYNLTKLVRNPVHNALQSMKALIWEPIPECVYTV